VPCKSSFSREVISDSGVAAPICTTVRELRAMQESRAVREFAVVNRDPNRSAEPHRLYFNGR